MHFSIEEISTQCLKSCFFQTWTVEYNICDSKNLESISIIRVPRYTEAHTSQKLKVDIGIKKGEI